MTIHSIDGLQNQRIAVAASSDLLDGTNQDNVTIGSWGPGRKKCWINLTYDQAGKLIDAIEAARSVLVEEAGDKAQAAMGRA